MAAMHVTAIVRGGRREDRRSGVIQVMIRPCCSAHSPDDPASPCCAVGLRGRPRLGVDGWRRGLRRVEA
jgi:hypothetical protein